MYASEQSSKNYPEPSGRDRTNLQVQIDEISGRLANMQGRVNSIASRVLSNEAKASDGSIRPSPVPVTYEDHLGDMCLVLTNIEYQIGRLVEAI